MNKPLVYSLLLSAALWTACNDDEDTSPENVEDQTPVAVNLRVSGFDVMDLDNENAATDYQASYSLMTDTDSLAELRLFLSKSDQSLDTTAALANINYLPLTPSVNRSIWLPEGFKDTDGESITESVNYHVHLLAIYSTPYVMPAIISQEIAPLANEIVVTTPEITGPFGCAEDIVVDDDGNFYVNDFSQSVYKVTPNLVSTLLTDEVNQPVGITIDSEGHVYVTNYGNTSINKITPSGEASTIVTDSRLQGGGGIAIDSDGVVYNTYWASRTLYKIQNGVAEAFVTHSAFNGPIGVAYDEARDLIYVGSANDGKIFTVDDEGTVTELIDTPGGIAHLAYLDDKFYTTDWNNHKVRIINRDGTVEVEMGQSSSNNDGNVEAARFSNPNGIEPTKDGKIIYVSQSNNKLRKIIMPRD